ncbi:hypothetical protein VCHA27O13_20300 [Vibrio chagasii]|nr:hypothetical protein VCHA27O13_20300 [Vibrio chagasii]
MTIRHICVIKSQPKLTKDTMLSQILKKTATTVVSLKFVTNRQKWLLINPHLWA